MDAHELLRQAEDGLATLDIGEKYRQQATLNLGRWLTEERFEDYWPQLEHLINNEEWSFLLDAFYQIIPFGTGGRRGLVGIGPNRINPYTIKDSAQGHAQYLINHYGDEAKRRGVVLAYDVRQFLQEDPYDPDLPNPVRGLTCKDLAVAAAKVYAANGIKVYLFDDVRSTPELSFAIRRLGAVGGDMFSASHNPPSDNGKKVYDEHGGQLIPPHDQELVTEVTQNVEEILETDYDDAIEHGRIIIIGQDVDAAYVDAATEVARSDKTGATIVFSPLHGTGITSIYPVLSTLGHDVTPDPATENTSGRFEHVTFNIPNPEVEQSFDHTLPAAKKRGADLILNCDPDADRLGCMALHNGEYRYLNGNEIGIILTAYGLAKHETDAQPVVIKTMVTTTLIERIANKAGARTIGDLLVGFKYVGEAMNQLEREGALPGFIIACEESHGYLTGPYARDKDGASGAVWLAELASALKDDDKTLIDYLNEQYAEHGYCHNYLTEIRLPGAEGQEKIDEIQKALREEDINAFGEYPVTSKEDYWDGEEHKSETDTASRNVLRFHLDVPGTDRATVTVRPSGTEPKIKFYFETLAAPAGAEALADEKTRLAAITKALEKTVLDHCYDILDVDFPERGYLLFWQLPLNDKLRYFEIEEQLANCTSREDAEELLGFLGANPFEKVDEAFKKRYGKTVLEHLG